jgi:hypothetical protein
MAVKRRVDTADKGQNELGEMLACAPVKTSFRNRMHRRELTKAAD